jgi:hypothetical protein
VIVSDPVDALILDLLEWIGKSGRPYAEVMEAWRTSCPRLPVWEEANRRGLLDQNHNPSNGRTVSVSALGLEQLQRARTTSDVDHTVRDLVQAAKGMLLSRES